MKLITIDQWDKEIWEMASPVYQQAFGGKGAKPEKIIQNMLMKRICYLHLAIIGEDVLGMALTGKLKGTSALLIDYLTVHKDWRNKGLGLKIMDLLKDWAATEGNFDSMVIEVESDKHPQNAARIQFWEKCGFSLTEYIHHYKWVPESYQAMYLKLHIDSLLPIEGEVLFKYIGEFHKASYR
ncbi:GNAT family N-acetyltransferase [Neobacillus ginsengisoli]|uniref:GNAT superfamily N-acetyltransferase n=1 Tax=Neobacillus ginsengisoli TaxID=904295 RepID=A0ABT9XXN7_9BACI|nr:GNAT family N-acetyltransferase [Neobacillus ginsengisoli]MDQ0200116.1 GNAT superfamily N-acetyltransferase [Neobacillus ginsengisoli]